MPANVDPPDAGATGANAERIRAGQISALSGAGVVGAASGLAGTIILAIVLTAIEGAPPLLIGGWAIVLAASYFGQIYLCLSHRRRPSEESQVWARRFTGIALIEGIVWGVGVVAICDQRSIEVELTMLLMSTGVGAGSALTFGSLPSAFRARFLPATLPYAVWSAAQGDALHYALTVLTLVFVAAIMQLASQYSRNFLEMLRLRYANVDLVAELREQTDAANRANISKSRFLASASHDLRQPVHAMNLFVSALQFRKMDTEARRIVSHIDSAVRGLDELFASLLDISKLDAGVISFRPQVFAVQTLLERVRRDHEAEARNKGVRLVVLKCSSFVRSEPILLERILRNLVSNAVRHTTEGGVLVGCRRTGPQLSLQVWDTGPGIGAHEQERVFEEFYQVDNPERDRSKGLGLGLAIVRRLANLLAAELTLESKPGSGSVFKVAVPLASAPHADSRREAATLGAVDRSGLILVVDDEVSVQDGMSTLLTSWGHRVIVAGSGDEIVEKIAASPQRPDLVICDYRLRRGEDGVAVIQRLREEYNDETLPGLLITGDTAPDRLQQAQSSGLMLLHKPVPSPHLLMVIRALLARDAVA